MHITLQSIETSWATVMLSTLKRFHIVQQSCIVRMGVAKSAIGAFSN